MELFDSLAAYRAVDEPASALDASALVAPGISRPVDPVIRSTSQTSTDLAYYLVCHPRRPTAQDKASTTGSSRCRVASRVGAARY